jgi:hypothetical protein
VTVTGIAGEFTTIPFRVRRSWLGSLLARSEVPNGVFEASEVALERVDTFPTAGIYASAPDGVGSLDIVYDVRTRSDA